MSLSLKMITELLLYLSIILWFSCLISLVFSKHRLHLLQLPKKLVLLSLVGTLVFSFVPVGHSIYLYGDTLGFWGSLVHVLFQFQIGRVWIFILVITLLLFGIIRFNPLDKDPFLSKIALFLGLLILGGFLKLEQASSFFPIIGFIFHLLYI